jgi:hypothetical protein
MLALSLVAPPALLGLALTMQALESRLLGRPEVADRRRSPDHDDVLAAPSATPKAPR